jgi:hypothetical protein
MLKIQYPSHATVLFTEPQCVKPWMVMKTRTKSVQNGSWCSKGLSRCVSLVGVTLWSIPMLVVDEAPHVPTSPFGGDVELYHKWWFSGTTKGMTRWYNKYNWLHGLFEWSPGPVGRFWNSSIGYIYYCALACADDVVLLSTSSWGLKVMLNMVCVHAGKKRYDIHPWNQK